MPATTERRGELWRVVDPDGRLVRSAAGSPVDGGGYRTESAAEAQARAINARTEQR